MHRYYLRILKLPTSGRILHDNKPFIFNKERKLHVCPYQNHVSYRDRPLHQVSPSASSTLFSHMKLGSLNITKYYSHGDARAKILTEEKSIICSNESITPSNQVETTEDKTSGEVNNEFNLFEDIDYDEIAGGDEEKMNRFKLLVLEIDVMRQDGMNVPSKMSTEQWKELFALQSRSQRRKYLTFLFKKEMKKLSDKRKKEMKRLGWEKSKTDDVDSSNEHLQYGFRGSTIFLRIYETTINAHDNNKLIQAMRFGQDIVIDCGFFNDMNRMENTLCCKQLVYIFAENRLSKDPFNIHFCNLNKDSYLYNLLKKSIPTLEDPAFPINIYEENYLNLFPKEKLVYLTPHCRTELKEFDPDDIYIIGAIVDKVNQNPLTLAKAKSEGLRMAQLPLDRYLDWHIGNKSLTVNQVVSIMHDMKVTGNWDIALKHVPQRKIRQPGEPVMDRRKSYNRGTTLQPPERFNRYY